MADVEDEAEFGSHFLDSMLEVEMTEEDNELDVSKNSDPLETLPPIPTFDLQSETLSYKDVYKNPTPQPAVGTLPLDAPPPSNVPLVINPNSMDMYTGEMAPGPPKSVMPLPPLKKLSPRAKTPSKNANVGVNISKNNSGNDTLVRVLEPVDEKFVEDVFRPEFVKNVFVKADPPWNIAVVSNEEMKYYKTCFKDVSKVQNCRLHCTICDKHLGCATSAEKKISNHTMLKVLTCKTCFDFYGDGNFPCDKGDNCEIYCRWCGQGGALVCCSFCPRVFCKRCVKRNFGPPYLKSIEKADDWACFCCAQKPLWPHRAICRALFEFIALKKTDSKTPPKDSTSCCKGARKRLRSVREKQSTLEPQVKVNPSLKSYNAKIKSFSGERLVKEQKLSVKPIAQLKASDRIKVPTKPVKPGGTTNIFSPRSVVSGNSIIRGITTSGPAKLFSAFTSPQLIQTPVLHGETLITPPSRFLIQAKTPVHSSPPPLVAQTIPYVRVSLTHQTPNLDLDKIPTVKIPTEVQGLILRLIFPDNKIQYVRLTSDGSSRAAKEFPMPQFKVNSAESFIEQNLVEAYNVSKTMYDKLTRIREKINSKTRFTQESVLNSSVKKLHLAYEGVIDSYRELDKSLLENHQVWKNGGKVSVDVIDISDDETPRKTKSKQSREKCKKPGEDSDIEIIDDVVANGETPANYKEKYRSQAEIGGVMRKRKKGRGRRNTKRLKTKMQNGEPEEEVLGTAEKEKQPAAATEAATEAGTIDGNEITDEVEWRDDFKIEMEADKTEGS